MIYTAKELNLLCTNKELTKENTWQEVSPETKLFRKTREQEGLFKTVMGEMIDVKYTLSEKEILDTVIAVSYFYKRRYNVK
jgi:hypothetical protein